MAGDAESPVPVGAPTDANPVPGDDVGGRAMRLDPERWACERASIVCDADTERERQFARPVGHPQVGVHAAALRHCGEPHHRLQRSHEDRRGVPLLAGDHVEAGVDPVGAVDVGVPGRTPHGLDDAILAEGRMGGRIVRPPIRLGLDDDAGGGDATKLRYHQATEQSLRDLDDRSGIEYGREGGAGVDLVDLRHLPGVVLHLIHRSPSVPQLGEPALQEGKAFLRVAQPLAVLVHDRLWCA